MIAARSRKIGRIAKVVLTLVAVSALISVRAAEQPAAEGRDVLRRAVEARFDVIPLSRGIALAGRTLDRRVEIAGGVVLSEGAPLSGAELRRRFGADADLVLRLSYLSDDELRSLFSRAIPVAPPPPADAASTAPAATPTPPAAPTPARPAAPPALPRADPPAPPAPPSGPVYRRTGARIAIARPIVVAADEDVRDGIFSIGGPVRVEGRVRDEIVVVGSRLELTPTAEVRGDITLVGGELVTAPGARHIGQVHQVVTADWPRCAWPSVSWAWFRPGGLGSWLPLAGTTTRVLLLALAMIVVAIVARGRVARIGAAAAATPVQAGLIGLVAQIVFVPAIVVIAFVMAITIVGLPFIAIVVPLAVVTMFVAMLVGFTGVAQRVGARLGHQLGWAESAAAGAAVAGMTVIVLPTVVARLLALGPEWMRGITFLVLGLGTLVEYVAWTIGLGAAIRTGLGRWAVVPPPVPPPTSFDTMADAPSTP